MATAKPLRTLWRILKWQIYSRLVSKPTSRQWIEGSTLVVQRGMYGATGNLYFGLHEFVDMAFVLHLLRPEDLVLDIGANVGTYTILGSKLVGAETWAFEPDPDTALKLEANIRANDLESNTRIHNFALGKEGGTIGFTKSMDAMNHVAYSPAEIEQNVRIEKLDDVVGIRSPIFIKMDVEGHETAVLEGASKTLANQSLVAIEIETVDEAGQEIIESAGFVRRYYDPFKRLLTEQPNAFYAHNQLYVKDEVSVLSRVKGARQFDVYGLRV
jgi:FkbM family methyltransferase